MIRSAFVAVLLSATGLLACNTAPQNYQRNWATLVERGLPGEWVSDKYGTLIIACSGLIHLNDDGGFDFGNTGLKNAKIIEMREKALLIEVMPLIKTEYPMERYPYIERTEDRDTTRMRFWGREWRQTVKRSCDSGAPKPASAS